MQKEGTYYGFAFNPHLYTAWYYSTFKFTILCWQIQL